MVVSPTGGGFSIPFSADDWLNGYAPFYNFWSEAHWFSNKQMISTYIDNQDINMFGTVAGGVGVWPFPENYWFGTSTQDFLSTKFYDYTNTINTYVGIIDYTNARVTPFENNHGVVTKILVNNKDAQDEYALMDPIGVGSHEFKVYFNRAMDTSVNPQIFYGVTIPYTQKLMTEQGSWTSDGKIYTVTHEINIGAADGINRIRVQGAQDLDFIKIPVEDMRFNMLVQSAGSASLR